MRWKKKKKNERSDRKVHLVDDRLSRNFEKKKNSEFRIQNSENSFNKKTKKKTHARRIFSFFFSFFLSR